jgi:hypothetical protein
MIARAARSQNRFSDVGMPVVSEYAMEIGYDNETYRQHTHSHAIKFRFVRHVNALLHAATYDANGYILEVS